MISTAEAADVSFVPAYQSPFASPSPSSTIGTTSQSQTATSVKPIQQNPDDAFLEEHKRRQEHVQKTVQQIQERQENLIPIGKITTFIQSPQFQSTLSAPDTLQLLMAFKALNEKPTQYYFYSVEALWLIAIFGFRVWKKFKSKNFLNSIWVQIYTFWIYLIGAIVVIPACFLGSQATLHLWKIVKNMAIQFWK